MPRGPIDLIMIRFAGADMSTALADKLRGLIDAETIRIIDLMFVTRTDADSIVVTELGDLDDATFQVWNDIVGGVDGILTASDAELLAEKLEIGNSAIVALYENTWAREMNRLIAEVDGEILLSDRIPRAVMDQLLPVS